MFVFKMPKLLASELCAYRNGNVLGMKGFIEQCLVWLCLIGLDTEITLWGSSGPSELIGKCKWKTVTAGKELSIIILAVISSWGLSHLIAFLLFFMFSDKTEEKKKKQSMVEQKTVEYNFSVYTFTNYLNEKILFLDTADVFLQVIILSVISIQMY